MGWRFRKRIKLFPGIYLNISKSGLGLNIGSKGANVSVGPNGTYVNTGIPGTGLYRRDKINSSEAYSTGAIESTNNYNRQEHSAFIDSVESEQNTRRIPVSKVRRYIKPGKKEETCDDNPCDNLSIPYDPKRDLENYHYPTLDLLQRYESDFNLDNNEEEQIRLKYKLVDLLRSFGVEISTIKCHIGPRVVLFEITLAPGININTLIGLGDDIALSFSSSRVRIAHIPEKGTIGIEIPKQKLSIVSMASILNTKRFQETTMDLPCAIGKTITNEVFMFDLATAPHVLIAGSTGQGKSVAINTIITSLLYKKHPAEMKLVLMDPQITELGLYRPISNHFLASLNDSDSVVTTGLDALNTLSALNWEIDTRHQLLSMVNVRHIKDYNKLFVNRQLNLEHGHRYMPYIVVVIDSYSALALGYETEMTDALTKIVEGGRAVGVHLIITTKRPSSDIISSKMKSYIPTRISFCMPEKIDSQVILDCNGAEELVEPGDMLFKNKQEIIRIQGAFIDTPETQRIINYISCQQSYKSPFELPDYYDYDDFSTHNEPINIEEEYLDPMFEDAARLIVREQCGSTSLIQRKFAIGYNRAGRLMNQLEYAGIVGVAHGSKPREVLITDENSLKNLLSQWKE